MDNNFGQFILDNDLVKNLDKYVDNVAGHINL